jgi:hypothetical protein
MSGPNGIAFRTNGYHLKKPKTKSLKSPLFRFVFLLQLAQPGQNRLGFVDRRPFCQGGVLFAPLSQGPLWYDAAHTLSCLKPGAICHETV